MDTSSCSFFQKCLYSRFTNTIPFKPLLIWSDALKLLDQKYAEPDVNLTDSIKDIELENAARHITGIGLATSQYGRKALGIGIIKEGYDLIKEFFNKGRITSQTWEDSKLDMYHNFIGFLYMTQNPDSSPDELMDFALECARAEQEFNSSHEEDSLG